MVPLGECSDVEVPVLKHVGNMRAGIAQERGGYYRLDVEICCAKWDASWLCVLLAETPYSLLATCQEQFSVVMVKRIVFLFNKTRQYKLTSCKRLHAPPFPCCAKRQKLVASDTNKQRCNNTIAWLQWLLFVFFLSPSPVGAPGGFPGWPVLVMQLLMKASPFQSFLLHQV